MPQLWRIVGGADKGGIVVREGKALNSAQAAARLGHGALVEELELQGERLNFRKLEGDGPAEGWVSVRLQDKVLAEKEGSASPAPASSVAEGSLEDGSLLLAKYKAGELDSLVASFRALLREMPFGRFPMHQPEPRVNGAGTSWAGWTEPEPANGRKRLILTGDSITHGPPHCNGAPWPQAIAERNPGLCAVNVGWGGIMSMSLFRPGDFNGGDRPVPLPRPEDIGAELVCVLIGTNDAMAIAGTEESTDMSYASQFPGPGPCRLPPDWRERCRPSAELYEESLGNLVRAYREKGAQVAVATVPMLGEDTTDGFIEKQKVRCSPYLTVKALGDAARRVCAREGASVLPLFECMEHRVKQLQRPPNKWSPQTFMGRMASTGMQQQKAGESGQVLPWEDLGAEKTRPEFLFDLVHFNEHGGALHAALVQSWLDAQTAS